MRTGRPKVEDPLVHHSSIRLTEEEWTDLKVLAAKRHETQSETLRACFIAVVNQAKRKGVWEENA